MKERDKEGERERETDRERARLCVRAREREREREPVHASFSIADSTLTALPSEASVCASHGTEKRRQIADNCVWGSHITRMGQSRNTYVLLTQR